LRQINEDVLDFDLNEAGDLLIDKQTGSTWDILTGIAIDGPYQDQQLQRLPSQLVYWFAWTGFYPETGLYNPR
jgi:hypothetical protein